MGQEPNIEIEPTDLPREGLPRGNPGIWETKKPGVIVNPGDVPRGRGFGRPGPDTGYALVLIRGRYPDGLAQRTESVLAALVAARAAHFGRAPIGRDVDVAEKLLGLTEGADAELLARQKKWVDAVTHEKRPGDLALEEVGDGLYASDLPLKTWSSR